MDDRLDLGRFVPRRSDDVETHHLVARDGSRYAVLRSPESRYLRLDEVDFALWKLMDGARTVQEIALAHFLAHGDFAADRLGRLVWELRVGGFLGPAPTDAFAALQSSHEATRVSGKTRRAASRLASADLFRLQQADALVGGFYRRFGWVLYSPPAKVAWVVIIAFGVGIWMAQFLRADHSLLKTNGSYLLGLLTIAVLDVLGMTVHDFAQALTLKRYGRRINTAGLMLYYGMPTLFLETSDVWLARRSQRIAVTWSGPCAMLVLGSALALMALPLDGTELGAFLFKGATIWLANAFFNLLPILDLDGYYMLVDYLEMPALRQNSAGFARGLLEKLRARERLTREELIFTVFGVGSALLLLLIPLVVYWARDLRYADSLLELWNSSELLGEAIAVAMFLLFLGPAAVAIVRQPASWALALAQIGAQALHRRLGRVPADHVEALSRLPFLRDASRGELVAVAHHLRVQGAAAGTILVRQGARGDQFFLIQQGTVRVHKVTSSGERIHLARLGPGDYFGEAALLERVPRTATVAAESDVRLLSLDGGHFRRWLGDRPAVSDAIRRSRADRDRLARLPLLLGTGPSELDRLAERLLVTRHSSGDTILRQGDRGDRFYLLVDGRVQVLRDDGDGSTVVAELGPGDFFGEMALLYDEPRSATVRAMTPVEAYTLDAAEFHALLGRVPVGTTVRRAAARRASQRRRAARV